MKLIVSLQLPRVSLSGARRYSVPFGGRLCRATTLPAWRAVTIWVIELLAGAMKVKIRLVVPVQFGCSYVIV